MIKKVKEPNTPREEAVAGEEEAGKQGHLRNSNTFNFDDYL